MRPNFHSVGAYDGMHMLYQALKQTGGDSNGDKLLAAMKGHGMDQRARPGQASMPPRATSCRRSTSARPKPVAGHGSMEFDQVEKVRDPGV
jgi:branched-chain amino acid transport system substrate-binding protein